MDDIQQKIKDNFTINLKAEDYLETVTRDWSEDPGILQFMLVFINDVLRSGRFRGSKLLEIGSGATVHNIASASAYFPNITMSDYVVDNLENLKRWVEGKSNLIQLLDIPAGLEGYGNDLEAGKKTIESRIRTSIKRVARCDVLTDQVLLDNSDDPETSPPFDMIISCLCMETAPKDYNSYCKSFKNVRKLLRTGGGLLMCGFFQASSWIVGGTAFNYIQIGEEELLDALSNAGFGKINIKTRSGKDFTKSKFSYDKVFCVVAEKL